MLKFWISKISPYIFGKKVNFSSWLFLQRKIIFAYILLLTHFFAFLIPIWGVDFICGRSFHFLGCVRISFNRHFSDANRILLLQNLKCIDRRSYMPLAQPPPTKVCSVNAMHERASFIHPTNFCWTRFALASSTIFCWFDIM